MIVVMKSEATKEQVDRVTALVREMGLKDHVIVGTDLTVVAVIGDDRKKDKGTLEQVPLSWLRWGVRLAQRTLLRRFKSRF